MMSGLTVPYSVGVQAKSDITPVGAQLRSSPASSLTPERAGFIIPRTRTVEADRKAILSMV